MNTIIMVIQAASDYTFYIDNHGFLIQHSANFPYE